MPQRILRIKICCISSVEEARTAVKYGASALELVGHMPSGPGVISDDELDERKLDRFMHNARI